ncbi:MAG: hypothetical protein A2051_03605 [Desulfovibrionales bacterium GWA2_65_9]|nr:MAG: hypothetical protein A2051_03605 [Desulfovibrionales bacterium GWA2_65_9]
MLLAALCLAACAPAAKPRPELTPEATKEAELQREFALESLLERQDRLNALGYTMITANEPLCRQRGRVRKSLGLTADYFNTRDSKEWLPVLSKKWGVGENTIVVTGVVPGSAAAKAGVLRGDVITSMGVKAGHTGKRLNVTQEMDDMSAKGPVTLKLLRAGKTVSVTIPAPVDVCDSRFVVRIGDAVNAYADGKNVIVTYGIMNLYSKDEDLAVVLGHELAHNILGHARKDESGKMVPSTPEKEAEADAVGLYFTARAGFSIENAPNVWRRMAAQNPAHIRGSLVHPSSASRFVDMEAIKNEIMQRQAAGLPLIPKPRVVPGQ